MNSRGQISRSSDTRRDGPSSKTRHGQRQPRNPITHEGMDYDDQYTASGNMHAGSTSYHGLNQPQHDSTHVNHGRPEVHMEYHGHGQMQSQGHIFRTAQASQQMVYEVYGNCLTMLEEMESRELRHQGVEALPRSDIHLPSQQQYDDSTIQRKLETQLLLFQTQLDSCDKGIKEGARQELKERTLAWFSQRQARKIPEGVTDHYTGKLYEVLARGETQHPEEFNQPPTIDEAGMQKAMQGIVESNHRRDMLDEDFKKNPDKKAKPPKTRGDKKEITLGAERLATLNPELERELGSFLEQSLR